MGPPGAAAGLHQRLRKSHREQSLLVGPPTLTFPLSLSRVPQFALADGPSSAPRKAYRMPLRLGKSAHEL